jgi:hypothetical protein
VCAIEWNIIKNTIAEAAKGALREEIGRRNEEWFDEECRKVIQEKNNIKKSCYKG